VRSAEAATPAQCRAGLGVGERILAAVEATRAAVGCNTNLGMLLLFAPLIRARESGTGTSLRQAVARVLRELDAADAEAVYAAIRLANPGGLGTAPRHDVHSPVSAGLLEAMAAAAERDRVARQYSSDFEDIFDTGLKSIKKYKKFWKNLEWATVGCYLTFMALFPDSHVGRKHGPGVAEATRKDGARLLHRMNKNNDPEAIKGVLLDFDRELKNSNINPGTSADLTAASLLLYHFGA
jgi:triphosphoribosyl-dephospho-CoA synthase